ncbi:hypothetical protein TRFO_20383 [Tritrichomonas foetus]|uniref:Uncharacterized protein n=1 Tax=Tritrichomonas foetus TaxID=1144522 RepID=A0A1J4KH26_9EUKA|nr:hypothetical protein TRFO_20383 [Tritrichomonas foetus]|eukprot:OHT10346.1 hypothetical protein TRFO_20383 [Tritrichomonas foetus]
MQLFVSFPQCVDVSGSNPQHESDSSRYEITALWDDSGVQSNPNSLTTFDLRMNTAIPQNSKNRSNIVKIMARMSFEYFQRVNWASIEYERATSEMQNATITHVSIDVSNSVSWRLQRVIMAAHKTADIVPRVMKVRSVNKNRSKQ